MHPGRLPSQEIITGRLGSQAGLGAIRRPSVPSWLLLAIVGVILYGSLLPLSFDWSQYRAENLFGLASIRLAGATREDLITNLVIYLPIGLAFFFCRLWSARRLGVRLLGSILSGAMVSVLAEALQTGISARVASWTDVLLNTCGAAAGAMLAPVLYRTARWTARFLGRRMAEHPVSTVTVGLCVLLFAYNLMPFDFVTDAEGLRQSFRRASWSLLPGGSSLDSLTNDLAGAAWMAILGYFMTLHWLAERRSSGRAMLDAITGGIIFVVVLELTQFLTRSHVFELSDIFLRSLAVMGGAILAAMLVDRSLREKWTRRPGMSVPTFLIAAFLLCQVVALCGPVIVGNEHAGAGTSGGSATFLPFEELWRGSMLGAARAITSSAGRYAVLVFTAGLWLKRADLRHAWPAAAAVASLTVCAVEGLRSACGASADLTGPILALVTALGVAWTYPRFRRAALGWS